MVIKIRCDIIKCFLSISSTVIIIVQIQRYKTEQTQKETISTNEICNHYQIIKVSVIYEIPNM